MKGFLTGILLALIVASLDQYSKYYIFSLLEAEADKQITLLPFFNLVMVHNFGVSFGMFNDIPYGYLILSVVAIIITMVLLVWLWREQKLYLNVALGLIIGGAVGNIIDRVRFGAVADFLDFHVAGYHWPAFNLADSTVFIGVAMILLENLFTKGVKNDKNI